MYREKCINRIKARANAQTQSDGSLSSVETLLHSSWFGSKQLVVWLIAGVDGLIYQRGDCINTKALKSRKYVLIATSCAFLVTIPHFNMKASHLQERLGTAGKTQSQRKQLKLLFLTFPCVIFIHLARTRVFKRGHDGMEFVSLWGGFLLMQLY